LDREGDAEGVAVGGRARPRAELGEEDGPDDRHPEGVADLPRPDAAKVAAGWELCLDELELALAGTPRGEFPEGRWVELHEAYAEQFGVSPEPGRQALRERQEAASG
jgi:hypothetical protein